MPAIVNQPFNAILGTSLDNDIVDGFATENGDTLELNADVVDKANGLEGDDLIATGLGNDLAAGDMVGDEWTLENGRWVYNAAAIVVSTYGHEFSFDDVIETGAGDDVLLGNRGNDRLYAGLGNDILNGGFGADDLFGGEGDDILNLEEGNDYAEGGFGADIVNGGAGDDVIYGDNNGLNVLVDAAGATTFNDLAQGGAWTFSDDLELETISQSAATVAGETYKISFDLAANLSGGYSAAMVEVLWNGEVVETVQTNSGAYTTFEVDVVSTGEAGNLSFRAVESVDAVEYNYSGEIVSYEKTMTIAGADVTVSAYAPGQSKLYQVIDGQLHVFDTVANTYTAIGDAPSFNINAVGFNIEDDLIYGVAKSNGTDSLGNPVSTSDIVMVDAEGATYRIGEGFYGDYVGDFDDSGNLWTFHSSLDRISVVDVDNRDQDGNPQITYHKFPAGMFTDRTFDLAYDAATTSFYAVVAPTTYGGNGKVVRIDVSDVENGGQPTFSEITVTGTLLDGEMQNGMTKGAYGAVFFDGDGNLYYGLNRGDADMDASTGNTGAIFRINADWDKGTAYSEFMSEAPATGSNDGAVDPRSSDAFIEVDADAAVLLRDPVLSLVAGGDDTLRGGEGNDLIYGNEGNDDINGGSGNDELYGDAGADNILASIGDDFLFGGEGNDSLQGESGADVMEGNAGDDYMNGGTEDDVLDGGAGNDKLVGGAGSDVLEGGAGDDHIWGGNWSADGSEDVFVFAAGSGRDFVHDFEAEHDVLDLTAYDTDLQSVQAASSDEGWATIIELSELDGGLAGDQLILKSVALDDLSQDSFIC